MLQKTVPSLIALAALCVTSCRSAPKPPDPGRPSLEAVPGKLVEAKGVKLYVADAGEGEPIVLIHGLFSSSYLWRNVERQLARRYRVLAPDLAGTGRSERGSHLDCTLVGQAAILKAILDQLGIDRAILVGHDIGGGIAVHLLDEYPDRVRGVVLMGSALFHDFWPRWRMAFACAPVIRWFSPLLLGKGALRRRIRDGMYRKERAEGELVDHYYESLDTAGRWRQLLRLYRDLDPIRLEKAVLRCARRLQPQPPLMIIWGKHDVFQPVEQGEILARYFPRARLVILERCGHFLQEDDPDTVARLIEEFAASGGLEMGDLPR